MNLPGRPKLLPRYTPTIMCADNPTSPHPGGRPELRPHSVILFQGDSITDAGRNRLEFQANAPRALGEGYARTAALKLREESPDAFLQCYNRAVSGDTLEDLSRRWERDTFPLLPDLLSILIGVNDLWHEMTFSAGMDHIRFQARFRKLLIRTRKVLPDVRLVLCQPFLLPVGSISSRWMEEAVRLGDTTAALAEEFNAVRVPFQEMLNEAAADQPPADLLFDGVHPTPAGHALLADCWLEHVVGIQG